MDGEPGTPPSCGEPSSWTSSVGPWRHELRVLWAPRSSQESELRPCGQALARPPPPSPPSLDKCPSPVSCVVRGEESVRRGCWRETSRACRGPECPRGRCWARCPCGCSVVLGRGHPWGRPAAPSGWCWLCAIRSRGQVSGECRPLSGVQLGKGREPSGGASTHVALLSPSGPVPKAPPPGQAFAHLCSLIQAQGHLL